MHHEFLPDPPQADTRADMLAGAHANDPRDASLLGPQLVPAAPDALAGDALFTWPTLALLRSLPTALAEQWIHGGLIAAAARMAAEDARRCALPFERVLITLKREWSSLAEVRQLPIPDARDLLNELVTACIKAYYALPDGAAGASPADPLREQSLGVARTLLEVLHAYDPDAPPARDGASDGSGRCDQPSDAELKAQLARALDGLAPAEATALLHGLGQLYAALRAQRGPRGTARGGLTLPFRAAQ
jgi:hypothetical protein